MKKRCRTIMPVLCSSLLTLGLAIAGVQAQAAEPIQPIPPVKTINLAKVELGKKLYFDPRLSKSGYISCNSCHNLSMGGTDNLPSSLLATSGIRGRSTLPPYSTPA